MLFWDSTTHLGKAIPIDISCLPSGWPYFSKLVRIVSSVRLGRGWNQEGKRREKGNEGSSSEAENNGGEGYRVRNQWKITFLKESKRERLFGMGIVFRHLRFVGFRQTNVESFCFFLGNVPSFSVLVRVTLTRRKWTRGVRWGRESKNIEVSVSSSRSEILISKGSYSRTRRRSMIFRKFLMLWTPFSGSRKKDWFNATLEIWRDARLLQEEDNRRVTLPLRCESCYYSRSSYR